MHCAVSIWSWSAPPRSLFPFASLLTSLDVVIPLSPSFCFLLLLFQYFFPLHKRHFPSYVLILSSPQAHFEATSAAHFIESGPRRTTFLKSTIHALYLLAPRNGAPLSSPSVSEKVDEWTAFPLVRKMFGRFFQEARLSSTQRHQNNENTKYIRTVRERGLLSRSTREQGVKDAGAFMRRAAGMQSWFALSYARSHLQNRFFGYQVVRTTYKNSSSSNFHERETTPTAVTCVKGRRQLGYAAKRWEQ